MIKFNCIQNIVSKLYCKALVFLISIILLQNQFMDQSFAQVLELTPSEIINRADEIRNPSTSYSMRVEVVSSNGNDTAIFDVSIQGNTKTLIKTLEPLRDRGRNMLMLNEEMWLFIPNLKRSVRISLGQKLSGQTANGDISRMRWSGDYDAQFDRYVESNPLNSNYIIDLKAKKKGLTYDQIRVWIEKDNYRPVKAEFLSPAGKVLKIATYTGYRLLAGRERPGVIQIHDATREGEMSILRVLSMDVRKFQDSIFNQNSLR
jgi:outer membrane lipoprotein-sorting protein